MYFRPLRSLGYLSLVVAVFSVSLTVDAAEETSKDQPADRQPSDASVDFVRDIQPIFAAHCTQCHGSEKQEAGLRLDHRESALRGGDSGPVLVPGKTSESELLRRITSDEELEKMPPPGEDTKPLSEKQIARIQRWIEQGAPWPKDAGSAEVTSDHWAFQPVERPEPPDVQNGEWIRNPIDNFILAKLEAAGIKPSPEADRYTLIKRLYYDLIGLPPTPQQVDEFVNDDSPQAYERLVDRLLESPHFGERWGRHWLDKARYADSDGYEKDRPRPNAWRYRDWVIDAVNNDMPYDQFTIEQLAGDLLPDATPMQKLATAFHRQTLTNTEGGVDQEEFRVEAIIDRVNTTGTVWLGLTIGCAQCHSHKYDPITQAEFYQLFAFYNNGDETTTRVPVSEQAVLEYKQAKAEHEEQTKALQAKLQSRREQLAELFPAWEAQMRAQLHDSPQTAGFHPLEVVSVESESGATFEKLEDGSYLVKGKRPDKDTYTLIAKTDLPEITGIRLEVLPEDSLPNNGPGRADNGNFVLNEFWLSAAPEREFQSEHRRQLWPEQADFSQKDYPFTAAVDGIGETGWAVGPQTGKPHSADFSLGEPLYANAVDRSPDRATDTTAGLPEDSGDPGSKDARGQETRAQLWLKFELHQEHGSRHTLGRFRIQARTGVALPDDIREVLLLDAEQRNSEQTKTLREYYLAHQPEIRQLKQQLEELKKQAPEEPLMEVRVITQRTENPRTTHLLRRGDFLQPQQEVQPGTLSVLHPFQPREAGSQAEPGNQRMPNRLDLARWIVSPENPLTPRVAVNHIWGHLFGRGIVRTMNDFGTRGEPPTHPKLLDWLADEFIRQEWSRKAMIKLIVTSSAYRQSSAHRPSPSTPLPEGEGHGVRAELDPRNDLFHRQNRFRVEAETVRDLHLAASGLLSKKVGGPSVFPPMPPDVAALSYANNFRWVTSEGADRYRRGMYTFFKRTAPHPNLMTFDCPASNTTTVDRRTSNTPLQALTTLNDKVFVEAAQAMAHSILTRKPRPSVAPTAAPPTDDHRSDAERITQMFRRCVARPPSEPELDRLRELLAAGRRFYRDRPEQAQQFIGDYEVPGVPAEETAAWTATARIIMNTDEFITRE